LSEKYSELHSIINNYRYNIRNTHEEYKKNRDHKIYQNIIRDLTIKLEELKGEQQAILHRMRALQSEVYNYLGGGKQYSDDHNRRKYLKYKTKYFQLRQKNH
jgi:hypothetical protein